MTTAMALPTESKVELLERVVIGGDLSGLSSGERLQYYREVCASLGLNPLTKPFEYLYLNGKLILYARKDCTEQLRRLHSVSITDVLPTQIGEVYVVVAKAVDGTGRKDTSTGAVNTKGLGGEALANAMMKTETKAKRRVTLSICGLGMLDESEVESLPPEAVKPPKDAPKDVLPPPFDAVQQTETRQENARAEVSEARAAEIGNRTVTPAEVDFAPAPYAEWKDAIQNATIGSLKPLWAGCAKKEVWESFTVDQQTDLIDTKDQRKRELGITSGAA